MQGEEILRHPQTGEQRFRQYSCAPIRDAKDPRAAAEAILREMAGQVSVESDGEPG